MYYFGDESTGMLGRDLCLKISWANLLQYFPSSVCLILQMGYTGAASSSDFCSVFCLNMRLLPYFGNDLIYFWNYCVPCFHFTTHSKGQARGGTKCSWEAETSDLKLPTAHLEEWMTFCFQPPYLQYMFSLLPSSFILTRVICCRKKISAGSCWGLETGNRVCGWLAGGAADRRIYSLESKGNVSHVL